jgi:hypothetical protein
MPLETTWRKGRAHAAKLLTLTDTRGLRDLGDARRRVAAIAFMLAERSDPRGAFPLIYRIELEAVVAALDEGRLTDPEWVQAFETALARRYLDNLHRHLTEKKTTPPWAAADHHADNEKATITGPLAAAINAHLISDLPEALHASGVRAHHFADFFTLSRLIWGTAPDAIAAVKGWYGSDLSPLYRARLPIWPITVLNGRVPSGQERLFHSVTGIAFARGCAMANPLARPLIRAQIASGSRLASVLADQLIKLGELSPAM